MTYNANRFANDEAQGIFVKYLCGSFFRTKYASEEEVIEQANDSLYGLGGGVFTQNLNRAIRVARAIETGRMWVNTYNSIPAGAPFGGYKQSGIGRETHKVILEHYTQMKNIIINLSDKPSGFYDLD